MRDIYSQQMIEVAAGHTAGAERYAAAGDHGQARMACTAASVCLVGIFNEETAALRDRIEAVRAQLPPPPIDPGRIGGIFLSELAVPAPPSGGRRE